MDAGSNRRAHRVPEEGHAATEEAVLRRARPPAQHPARRGRRRPTQRFRVYLPRNARFPENFSVGLACSLPDGREVTLLRCNGPHGPHRDLGRHDGTWHATHHLHRAAADDLAEGALVANHGEATTQFASLEEAICWFARRCGLEAMMEHFPDMRQLGLVFGKEPP
jgi:hypothetical protein